MSRNKKPPLNVPPGVTPGTRPCGFCQTGQHRHCPRAIEQASSRNSDNRWHCPCWLVDPEIHAEVDAGESPGYLAPKLENSEEGPQMAQKVVTNYTSDLSGRELPEGEARTIRLLNADGKLVELDATVDEAEKYDIGYEKFARKYLAVARPAAVETAPAVTRGRRLHRRSDLPKSPASPASANGDSAKIRAWAAEQGIQVAPRGRISSTVVTQYHATH